MSKRWLEENWRGTQPFEWRVFDIKNRKERKKRLKRREEEDEEEERMEKRPTGSVENAHYGLRRIHVHVECTGPILSFFFCFIQYNKYSIERQREGVMCSWRQQYPKRIGNDVQLNRRCFWGLEEGMETKNTRLDYFFVVFFFFFISIGLCIYIHRLTYDFELCIVFYLSFCFLLRLIHLPKEHIRGIFLRYLIAVRLTSFFFLRKVSLSTITFFFYQNFNKRGNLSYYIYTLWKW